MHILISLSLPLISHIPTQFINAKLKKGRNWEFIEPVLCDQYYDGYFHAY